MKLGKEVHLHYHPQHKVTMEYSETPFMCDGCKEAGIGLEYHCGTCNFDLHKICALAPPTTTHPFYTKCEFKLYARPPGQLPRVCNACRNIVRGFVYHCTRCGFDLHPCCNSLPKSLVDGKQRFYLCDKISSPCLCCGGKGLGWSYQSECRRYGLHVSCVKEELVEDWQNMCLNVNKKKISQVGMRIPKIQGEIRRSHRRDHRKGKLEKCCEVAGDAVRVIVSAVLGDP
ncbi:uncharacterized protein LOC109842516, partial [Asparagus officinalis]